MSSLCATEATKAGRAVVGNRNGTAAERGRLAALVLAVALVFPAGAAAQDGDRQVYTAELTNRTPGASSGLTQRITYVNPADPSAKPPAVSQIVFRLPEGTRIDTTVPPQCGASEPEFLARGAAACPPETRVGSGTLSADGGAAAGPFPRVVETVVTFFNNQDELILFAESTNTPGPPIRVASRIAIEGNTLTSTVPPIPGAPPPEPFLAVKEVFNDLPPFQVARDGGSAGYITTPACPPTGQWTITATFTYRDGVTQEEAVQTPCSLAPRGGQGGASGGGQSGGDQGEQGQGQQGKGQGGGRGGDGGEGNGGGAGATPVGGVDAGLGGFAFWLLRPPAALQLS